MAQLSDEAIKQLTLHIEEESRKWAAEYVAGRRAFLSSRKISTSGALSESLGYEISQGLEGQIKTSLVLTFEDHGRFVDMKRLNPPGGGGDYIAALADWIVRKGLEQKFVSAFVRRRKLKAPPKDVLNRMAWGIAINRTKKYRRRSAWYARSKSAAITDLYNRVAAGLPDLVADEIKKAFKTT